MVKRCAVIYKTVRLYQPAVSLVIHFTAQRATEPRTSGARAGPKTRKDSWWFSEMRNGTAAEARQSPLILIFSGAQRE